MSAIALIVGLCIDRLVSVFEQRTFVAVVVRHFQFSFVGAETAETALTSLREMFPQFPQFPHCL
jgi:hypothetical protein